MGHPKLFSRACDIRRRAAESNINKAISTSSDSLLLSPMFEVYLYLAIAHAMSHNIYVPNKPWTKQSSNADYFNEV